MFSTLAPESRTAKNTYLSAIRTFFSVPNMRVSKTFKFQKTEVMRFAVGQVYCAWAQQNKKSVKNYET